MPHLGSIVRAYGAFGTKLVNSARIQINPSDLSALVDAKLAPGWGLPGWIQRETGIGLNSGLSFLRMAEWSGLFKAPPPFHVEKIVVPPEDSELCLLCDTDPRPAGLLLRTPEPVDWRRAKIAVYRRGTNGWDQRFDAKLTPSADGTSCVMSLLAEGVAVRVPCSGWRSGNRRDIPIRVRWPPEPHRQRQSYLEIRQSPVRIQPTAGADLASVVLRVAICPDCFFAKNPRRPRRPAPSPLSAAHPGGSIRPISVAKPP